MSKEIPQQNLEQTQKLTEIGDYLRQVREQHLLTIEQIATKTLIQARLLNAIEAGDLQILPEPVYIRGYIKRYAQALGLDGVEISEAFPIQNDMKAVQPSWKDTPAAQLRPLHLWVGYVLLIVAAVSGLSYLISRSASWVTAQPEARQATVSKRPTASPAVRPAASPTVSPAIVAANSKPVRVKVTLTAQSWLRVDADGKTQYEGVLDEGTQQTWTANKQLTIRAGNAGGVTVAYNDGQAKTMGEAGSVQEVTFPPSQNAASLPATTSLPQ